VNAQVRPYYGFSSIRPDNRYSMVVETDLDIDSLISIQRGLESYPPSIRGTIVQCKRLMDFPFSLGGECVVSSALADIVRKFQKRQVVGSIVNFDNVVEKLSTSYEVIDSMLVVDCADKERSIVDKALSITSYDNIVVYKKFIIDPAAVPKDAHFFRPLGRSHLVISGPLFEAIRFAGLSGLVEYFPDDT